MYLKSFIINKLDRSKNIKLEDCTNFYLIDVNSWFKTNGLKSCDMNDIRQYIFEEWLHKKIVGYKNKLEQGYKLVIIYDSPNAAFLELIKKKIIEIYDPEFCEAILVGE